VFPLWRCWLLSAPALDAWGMSYAESAKGIFRQTASKGIPLRAYNQRKKALKLRSDRDKMNAFADLLADGYEPEAAALMLGWVPEHGRTMLQRICKTLGWQAQ
jgi:hypothetical protein